MFEPPNPAEESFAFLSPDVGEPQVFCSSLDNLSALLEAQGELKSFFEAQPSNMNVLLPGKAVVVRENGYFYRGTLTRKRGGLLAMNCIVRLYDLQFSIRVKYENVRRLSGWGTERLRSSTRAFGHADLAAKPPAYFHQTGMGWMPPSEKGECQINFSPQAKRGD